MAELIRRSSIPSITMDVSDDNVNRIAQDVIDWVKRIGAFWRPMGSPSPTENEP